MARYKKSREDLVLKRAEYRKANEEFKRERKLRRDSQDPELVKKKKEKMNKSPYRQFVKDFAKKIKVNQEKIMPNNYLKRGKNINHHKGNLAL